MVVWLHCEEYLKLSLNFVGNSCQPWDMARPSSYTSPKILAWSKDILWCFGKLCNLRHRCHNYAPFTCLGYVAPELWRWQMSSRHSQTDSTVKQLRAHSHIWIILKISNFVESKLSMWQDIRDLNMNKRSSWNNPKTIRTGVKGVRASCSRPNHGRIEHEGLSDGQ